mgnify:CR=1 FL=1
MAEHAHPDQVLFQGEKPFPILPAVDHYAGSEKLMKKAEEMTTAKNYREALNLLARYFLARHGRDDKGGTANLEKAWHAVQAVLTFPGGVGRFAVSLSPCR